MSRILNALYLASAAVLLTANVLLLWAVVEFLALDCCGVKLGVFDWLYLQSLRF